MGGGSQRAGREPDGLASTPSLPRSSCVTLGKCLHFSEQLPHLWRGNNKAKRGPALTMSTEHFSQGTLAELLFTQDPQPILVLRVETGRGGSGRTEGRAQHLSLQSVSHRLVLPFCLERTLGDAGGIWGSSSQ